MSATMKHHHELTNGLGKCSVPMWMGGCPAGFCDEQAFGKYVDGERYPHAPHIRQEMRGRRTDNKFDGHVPGLACPMHGGPKCPGFEIEPGAYSGCDQSNGDCLVCGK